MTIERDSIPDLNIELMEDKHGSLILLEQDSCGNIERVAIHSIHLRYMAEKFGLIETSDPDTHKTIATLTRRLLVLRDRIGHLSDHLANQSDNKHADLTYGRAYATASADIAAEFCAELLDTTAPAPCKPDASTVQASLI
jgi:hypothetical protein